MGKMQRNKGKKGEREVARILRDHGYTDARRGQQFQGSPDSPDVVGLPGFHIEVKRTEQCRLYDYMEQAESDAGEAEIPVVFHRQNRKKWVAILDLDHFLMVAHMYSEYQDRLLEAIEKDGDAG